VNLDGTVDVLDYLDALDLNGGLSTQGWSILSNPKWNNRKGYAGYEGDTVLAGTKWHVRHRVLESEIGIALSSEKSEGEAQSISPISDLCLNCRDGDRGRNPIFFPSSPQPTPKPPPGEVPDIGDCSWLKGNRTQDAQCGWSTDLTLEVAGLPLHVGDVGSLYANVWNIAELVCSTGKASWISDASPLGVFETPFHRLSIEAIGPINTRRIRKPPEGPIGDVFKGTQQYAITLRYQLPGLDALAIIGRCYVRCTGSLTCAEM
jgi:hypothetical protein